MRIKNFCRILTTSLILVVAQASVAEPNSGFLDDYSLLKPDPDQKGAKIYIKPDANLGMYDKILFDPIEIFYAPDTKYKGISPDELKLLADAFRDLMVKELEPKYPVIQTPGKGVLRARLAITNVKMKKKKRSVLGYMPIGAALTAVKDIAGLRVILSASMIEAELIDSETNETIGLLVDTSSSDTPEGKESWEALQESLTFYAKRFRKRLDAAH
jgi:hypothetical protein